VLFQSEKRRSTPALRVKMRYALRNGEKRVIRLADIPQRAQRKILDEL
jgi:hypothetical protein